MSLDERILETARRALLRDLAAMRREVEAYPDDASLWTIVPGISNAGGTLALHIAGNLRHFIGATLGNSGYVRDRDAEFAQRGVSRADIVAQLLDAERAVDATLSTLDASRLPEEYPLTVVELRVQTGPYLLHLATHAAYHLGQLDYHRRMVTGSQETVGAMAIPPIFTPAGGPDA